MYCDLFVSSDSEGADCVSCFACGEVSESAVHFWGSAHTVDGGLTAQLLKHFGSTGQSVTRLADGDVEDQLVNAKLPHGIRALVFAV